MPPGTDRPQKTVRLPNAGAGGPYAPPSAGRRAFLTASTAAGLTGLWAGYAAVVPPLLTGTAAHARDRAAAPAAGPPAKSRPLAEKWLPHAPWAAESEWRVGSGAGTMYWDEWDVIRDGQAVEVTPFAAVFTDDAGRGERLSRDGAKRPTTLVAERAVLRFEKTVSADGPGAAGVASPGRVIAAVFTGAVRIDGADGMRVEGRDFTYRESSQKLWSDHPVAFAHGGHSGAGRGVEVELFRTGPASGYGSFAADGIARVEVAAPVRVDLDMKAGAFPGLDAAGGTTVRRDPGEDHGPPVHVAGGGPFAFDPHANTARFLSARGEPAGVRVWREHVPEPGDPVPAGGPHGPDELTCRTLTVRLEPETAGAKAEAAAVRRDRAGRAWGDRDFFAADDDLAAVAVVAEGSAKYTVRVVSPARGVTVTAARLDHDLPADVLTLSAAGPADAVTVTAPGARVRCPRLTVSPPDPAGFATKGADAPRTVAADGPGVLTRFDEVTGEPAATVEWPGTLTTGRDAATGRDVVTLTGRPDAPRDADGHTAPDDQVIVTQHAESTRLSGDVVRLHLEPAPESGAAPGDANPTETAAEDANPLGGSVRPAFAEAVGSVRMVGPRLLAGAKRAAVTFEDAPDPEPVFVARSESGGASARNTEPAREPRDPAPAGRETASGDAVAETPAELEPKPEPEPEKPAGPPAKFYADRVDARVVRARVVNGKEVAEAFVREAVADGNVGLFRTDDDGSPQYARAARGVVAATGPDDRVLTLTGRPGTADAPAEPATLAGSDAVLTGPTITFDPAADRAEVVGPGAIDLPLKNGGVPGLDPAGPDAGAGAPPRPADPVGNPAENRTARVQWGEKMTFDGAVATFHGQARTSFRGETRGVPGEEVVGLSCALMTVTLTEPVTFGDRLPGAKKKPKSGAAPAVDVVTCSGLVDVRGYATAPDPRTPAAGPTPSRRIVGAFAQLTVQWDTRDFTAEGPGRLRVWRRDDALRDRPTAGVTVRSNPPRARKRRAMPCELVDVTFKRDVAGNLNGPDAVFHPNADGRVTVVHGPVPDFGANLDPDALPANGATMEAHTLRLEHVPDPAGGAAESRTLLASGDVKIDGRTEWGLFNADGPTATWHEAKGKLSVFGTRPDSVVFTRRVTAHGERTQVVVKRADFFPARNRAVFDGVTGADGLP